MVGDGDSKAVLKKERKIGMKLKAYNCAIQDSKIYFVNYNMNMVYYWDLAEQKMHILDASPEEDIFKEGLFGNIICTHNKLVLVPLNASKIWMYDLNEKKWTGVNIPSNKSSKHNNFFGGMLNGEWIYLFGYNYRGILKVNTCTCETKDICIDESIWQNDYIKNGFLNWNYVISNNCLLTPTLCDNKVLRLDLETDEIQYMPIGNKNNTYVGIVWDGEKYWLAPREGRRYVVWDGDKSEKEFEIPKSINCEGQYFGGVYEVSGKILFTSFAGSSLLFGKDNASVPIQLNQSYIFAKKMSDERLVLGDTEGNVVLFDGEKEVIINTEIPESEYYKFLKAENIKNRFFSEYKIIQEKARISLNDFIKLIGD